MIHERGSSSDEEYILLASDGLWDVLSNEEAGRFFVSVLPAERSFEQVSDCLGDKDDERRSLSGYNRVCTSKCAI